MKKELPFAYPMITSHANISHYFSIFASYKGDGKKYIDNWIYSNYINIWVDIKNGLRFTSFERYECPFFKPYNIYNHLFEMFGFNIIDTIKNAIDLNYYFFFTYDRYYIPNTRFSNQIHQNHPGIIFGYNDEEKTFKFADFLTNSKYEIVDMSYEIIEAAFLNYEYDLSRFELFEYEFKIEDLIYQIDDFMNGTYKHKRLFSINENITTKQNETVYGYLCFDFLKNYIAKNDYSMEALQWFHVLYDFSYLMTKRIEWLISNNYLIDNKVTSLFEQISKECLISRNRYIKYLIGKNEHLKDEIINNLENIKIMNLEGYRLLKNNIIDMYVK